MADLLPFRRRPQPGLSLAADQHVVHSQDQRARAITARQALLVAGKLEQVGTRAPEL